MGKGNSKAWRKWHDPNATDEDYKRWREQHHKRVQDEAFAMMAEVLKRVHPDSSSVVARTSGLSAGTVRFYAKGKRGKRGPLLTTWIALNRR